MRVLRLQSLQVQGVEGLKSCSTQHGVFRGREVRPGTLGWHRPESNSEVQPLPHTFQRPLLHGPTLPLHLQSPSQNASEYSSKELDVGDSLPPYASEVRSRMSLRMSAAEGVVLNLPGAFLKANRSMWQCRCFTTKPGSLLSRRMQHQIGREENKKLDAEVDRSSRFSRFQHSRTKRMGFEDFLGGGP